MSAFKVGDRVRVKRNEQGRRLLAGWIDRTETGTVTVIVSEQHIIVQRDGCKPNGVTWAGYWTKELE